MRIALIYMQACCGQSEGPEENASRYTVRPGTLGWTLASNTEKRVVSCAVAHFVNAVPDSPLAHPCSFATVHICRELGGLGRKPRW
jgi:hypothetical protein